MRTLDPRLEARLASGVTTLCRCWRLDRNDGTTLGFTDHDEDVAFDGVRFAAATGAEGGAQETALGLAPGSAGIAGALSSEALHAADIAAGLWDAARLRRWIVDWREPGVRALTFDGRIGEIATVGAAFEVEALGPADALNRPLGRAYLRSCDAALGDARCRVDLDGPGLRAVGVVVAGRSGGRFDIDFGAAEGDGRFAAGTLGWTDARGVAATALIVRDAPGPGWRRMTLAAGASHPPLGAMVTATAGCDRSFVCCRDRFGNAENFRGFPHLPGDDFVLGAPTAGGA